ncbi:MAG: 3-keto-5-aminohexanoate cleavage protein [Terriglobales bacterium]|jgi:3-keto-5-aminohexanoate cleavage enzyme
MPTNSNWLWPYADSYAFMEKVREGMPPVIICVACNGGVQGKEYNESIPETADEIADSVYDAYKAGASMVHIHARDPQYLPDPARTEETWWEANSKVRERCPDIIINDTTGGGFKMTMEERLSCLNANPEIASLNLAPDMSKFHFKERKAPLPHPRPAFDYDDCLPFAYKQINCWAAEMKKRGIKPELEVYHSGCVWVVRDLISQGLLEKPYWVQTVMGYQTSSFPTVQNVLDLLRELPAGALWLCSGIGPYQVPMTTLAIILGGHVRVGLEDNIYYRRGEKAASNAQLVARAARMAHELNREVATPTQAREMLEISKVPSRYEARQVTRV